VIISFLGFLKILDNSINEVLNETLNETLVNESAEIRGAEVNEGTLNVTFDLTTRQYKAVINRPVKWVKKIKKEKNVALELDVEIPKSAENISIKTGSEARSVEEDIEEFEQMVDNTDRQTCGIHWQGRSGDAIVF